MANPDLDQRIDLRRLRDAAGVKLNTRLLAGDAPLAELRDLRERLGLLDDALAKPAQPDQPHAGGAMRPLAWPVVLIGAILLLAATVPVPSVPFSLEVNASSVSLVLPDATLLGAQQIAGELRIEGFTSLASGDTALAAGALREQANSLAIRSEQTWLRALTLPAGAQLTVQAHADATSLGVESMRSPVIADIEVRGKTTLRLGDAEAGSERLFTHSEWLKLIGGDMAHADRMAPPMSLSFARRGDKPLRIEALRPRAVVFNERRSGASIAGVVDSSLEGGTLTLPSAGQTVHINEGDWLDIDGLDVQRCEIIVGGAVTVKLNGSARVLRLKVGEFERSLKPSWLEFLSRHHLATLLWGSAVFLWGALAWIRKYFREAPS